MGIIKFTKRLLWTGCYAAVILSVPLPAQETQTAGDGGSPEITVDRGHPWRPPFGLDRVGAPLEARVKMATEPYPNHKYNVAVYRDGRQVETHLLEFTGEKAPYWATAKLESIPDEISLVMKDLSAEMSTEILRQTVEVPDIEADAVARPDRQINPVDLGAVLVPEDWLLLAGGQSTILEFAAMSRSRSLRAARLEARFGDRESVAVDFPLQAGRREAKTLELPFPTDEANEILHVSLVDGGQTLWEKDIPVMIVAKLPRWPEFGAVETKLRYDAPISVIDSSTGAVLPSLDYDTAWDADLNDVVVRLPNGSRFVFWRGTNYVPFWAGKNNTGICYQWGENLSIPIHHPDGTRDFPEPLYDFELRYGSIEIMESTASRVHVRWTYQATDVHYRVWGDQVREDFYFYPDGFGTRVLTIASKPGSRYQMSEFLILTPQAALPLEVLPTHIADVLFLDGHKEVIRAPFVPEVDPDTGKRRSAWPESRDQPAIFRIFGQRDDPAAAVYFYPGDKAMKLFSFTALYDQGQMVSPIYWGSHWPMGRGKITGWSVDDRIYSSPAHNSLGGWLPNSDGKGGWGNWEVKPIESGQFTMLDSMGNSRVMDLNRWSWLIGKTEASDEELLNWAQSFSEPPSIELTGAEVGLPSYSPERRAIRLVAKSSEIEIHLQPSSHTMNPVFELTGVSGDIHRVELDGRILPKEAYAWDGTVLWVNADIDVEGARLGLQFK